MSADSLARRRFLGTVAGGAAALWLAAPLVERLAADVHDGRDAPDGAWLALTAADAEDLDALAAQILPGVDGQPGAREARAVRFVDRALAADLREQRPLFEEGLRALRAEAARRWPGTASFAALDGARQEALVRALAESGSEFWEAARGAVLAGTFSDPRHGGNAGKAGWRLVGFEDRFAWTEPFGWYDSEAGRAG